MQHRRKIPRHPAERAPQPKQRLQLAPISGLHHPMRPNRQHHRRHHQPRKHPKVRDQLPIEARRCWRHKHIYPNPPPPRTENCGVLFRSPHRPTTCDVPHRAESRGLNPHYETLPIRPCVYSCFGSSRCARSCAPSSPRRPHPSPPSSSKSASPPRSPTSAIIPPGVFSTSLPTPPGSSRPTSSSATLKPTSSSGPSPSPFVP